jgi:uncharacterized protein YqhQ
MVTERRGAGKVPFVRGIVSLVESLKLGSEALRFSVEQLTEDLEADERVARAKRAGGVSGLLSALGLSLFALATQDAAGTPASDKRGKGPLAFMLVVAIAFLIALPQAASAGVNRLLHLGLEVQSPGIQLLTGGFKLAIVVGYLLLIRRMAEIRRVFQYHGAEHKTISTYEAGEALTVANARAKTTLHPRCGTTFLVMVALVSIIVFTAIGSLLPRIHTGNALLDNAIFFLEKLPFLPFIAAATFEVQRFFARFCTVGPLRALLWPGFLVQKITTAEPDDAQLEVALASLRVTLFRQDEGQTSEVNDDVAFPSYDALLGADRLRPAA